jgi:membrane protein required for colicin V production
MSWLDIVILLPLLIGLVRGLMKGLVIEIASIVAIVLGYVGSRLWGAVFAAWLIKQFSWPETVCMVVAYALLFISISIILHILARLLSKLFQKVSLGWLNRLLGGVFGVLKWAIIILTLVLCLHRLDEQFQFIQEDLKEQSIIYMQAAPLSEKLWKEVQKQIEEKQVNSTKSDTGPNNQ